MQAEKDYAVGWRFISLYVLNEDKEPSEEMRQAHLAGLRCLRVLDEVRTDHGNDAVAALYTELGNAHPRRPAARRAGRRRRVVHRRGADRGRARPAARAKHAHDESHDAVLRDEVEVALSRTGPNVGTPILTFAPGQGEREGSFFGPVISKAPRGEDAVKLWDAVETLATSGVAELKRSLRATPDFS